MNMLIYFLIVLFMILVIPLSGMSGKTAKPQPTIVMVQGIDSIPIRNSKKKWPIWQLGSCIIYEKDGSEIRRALIKEIHDHWVVYEKEGSLHDIMIDKIDRIQLGSDKSCSVYFDEKSKPYIWYH